MATEQITIAELDINTDALTKSAVETKKAIDAMNASQKELKKSTEDTTKEQVKNDIAIKKLKATYATQTKTLSALTDATNKQATADKILTDELNKEIKTENQATASNKKLLAARKEINATTEKGRKQITQINTKIDANNKLLKENASEQGKARLGVGGYESAIRKAFPQLSSFADTIKSTTSGLRAQKGALQASTVASGGLTKASRVLKIALISTGIGALVVALGSLVVFLTSTQRGMDAITKVTTPLKVIFQSFLGVVQDLGGSLFDAFSNPKQLLINLVDFLKGQVVNRIKAFAVILEGIINLDFKKISNGMLQAATGVEDVIGKVSELSKETSNFFSQAVKDAEQLRQLAIDIEQKEAELVLTRAKLSDQIKEQELLSKNTALTAAERNAAADTALRLSRELADAQKDIINLRIQEEELTQSLNDSGREDLKKLNELKAEAIAADTRQKATELRFLGAKNAVLKEEQALEKKRGEDKIKADEQELARIETFAAQKKELENQIALGNEVDAEEKAILKAEQDFEKQEAELENLTINQEQKDQLQQLMLTVQEEKLQAIRDIFTEKEITAEIAADKQKEKIAKDELRREQILQRQKLGILSSTFGQIQNLLGENSAAGKAAGIAQATINTYQGITDVWATKSVLPEPFATAAKVVSTGTVLASGLGAVAQIKGVSNAFYEGGQVPTGTGGTITSSGNISTQRGGDNVLATVKTGEVILNDQQQARAGGSAFFKSIGVPGFQTGGQVGGANIPAQTQAASINMEEFANVISEKVNLIKIVAIEQDISNAQALQTEIVDGANV